MKVERDLTTFKPVSLVFETHQELKEFVDAVGATRADAVLSYEVWNKLHEIVYGACSS